jgi:DNA-directed RNA polymerase specialized sigma24 family protein
MKNLRPTAPATSFARFLATPEAGATVHRVLSRLLPKLEREDMAQQVLLEALTLANPPVDPSEAAALLAAMARRRGINWLERRRARSAYSVGLTDKADRHAAPQDGSGSNTIALELENLGAFAREEARLGHITGRQLAITEAVLDGVPQSQIARAMALSYGHVRNELSLARAELRRRWRQATNMTNGARVECSPTPGSGRGPANVVHLGSGTDGPSGALAAA